MNYYNATIFLIVLGFVINLPIFTFAQKPEKENLTNKIEIQTNKIESHEDEIVRLEREYNEAFVLPNEESVERFHIDDFTTTTMVPARVTTKAQILGYVKQFGGRLGVVSTLFTEDLKVRLYAGTAVTTGVWKTVSRSPNGKDTSSMERFTRVWIKQNGSWRLAVSHYSPYFQTPKQQ